MTIPTFVSAGTLGAVATGSNVTPGMPAGWAADDIAVMPVMTNADNTFPTISGWTNLGLDINSANQSTAWYWRRLVAGDTAPAFTIASGTAIGAGNGLFARIYAFRGCPTTGTPFEDATVAGTPTSSTTPQTAEVTTTGADRLIVSLVMVDGVPLWSSGMPPSGWTNIGGRLGSTTAQDAMSDAIAIDKATAGTQAAATIGTQSTTDYWRTLTLALLSDSLVVADAFHGHTVDAVTLTLFTVDDASHANTVEAVALTQVHVLTVDDASHAHTVDAQAQHTRTTTAGSPGRTESFRMELLDTNNETVGELNPELGASIVVQTGATIGRTLTGLTLHDLDAMVDLRASRLRPWMTVDGVPSPLGVYVPTVATWHRLASGDVREVQAHDLSFVLTRTHRVAFGVEQGDSVSSALADLAILAGVTDYEIENTPMLLGVDLAWAPGSTIATAMAALCRLAGLTTPWFDVTGTLRVIPLPYVGADKPRRAWETGTASEITDGATEVDDYWDRANEWLAIGKSNVANLSGRFSLPDSHPLSIANGAIPVLHKIDVPGVATTAQCRDRARDAAQRDSRVHRVREFNCRTDPTLEQHDICSYSGEDYLLSSFTIPLQVGADQAISLRESLVVGEGT